MDIPVYGNNDHALQPGAVGGDRDRDGNPVLLYDCPGGCGIVCPASEVRVLPPKLPREGAPRQSSARHLVGGIGAALGLGGGSGGGGSGGGGGGGGGTARRPRSMQEEGGAGQRGEAVVAEGRQRSATLSDRFSAPQKLVEGFSSRTRKASAAGFRKLSAAAGFFGKLKQQQQQQQQPPQREGGGGMAADRDGSGNGRGRVASGLRGRSAQRSFLEDMGGCTDDSESDVCGPATMLPRTRAGSAGERTV